MSAVISSDPTLVLPALAFFAVAALYASVGHGGASAYLALMALTGFAPAEMKPVALTLNIAVSGLALVMFVHAGHFRMGLFLPLPGAAWMHRCPYSNSSWVPRCWPVPCVC
jgi:hypothetical protein